MTESLLGLVCSNRNLAFLDYNKVIVRRDYADVNTVKIVSGMGSGHEPAFAGFVGKGMLTAAIQGKYTVFVVQGHNKSLSVISVISLPRSNFSIHAELSLATDYKSVEIFLSLRRHRNY